MCVLYWFVLSQGRHLLRGSRLEDFDIRLGDSVCVPESLTDNQVTCRPPTNRPNKHINDTFCQDDTLYIDVCIHAIYRKVIVLWDPRGPIYKSLSLSSSLQLVV